LAALRSSDNDNWLRSVASQIALRYGARYECAMAWASHLDYTRASSNDGRPELFEVVSHLYEITIGPYKSGGSSGGQPDPRLRRRWEDFLTANKEQIASGHLFRLGIDIPEDLLPPGIGFHTAN
jgi:hypothetical protein